MRLLSLAICTLLSSSAIAVGDEASDKALAHLKKMGGAVSGNDDLIEFKNGTEITAADLKQLAGLSMTKMTKQGVDELKKALPKCDVTGQ